MSCGSFALMGVLLSCQVLLVIWDASWLTPWPERARTWF